MVPLSKPAIVHQALQEGIELQKRAVLAEPGTEAPLFEGGLVPSEDGMFWVRTTA
jgi:halogenation protein CepH